MILIQSTLESQTISIPATIIPLSGSQASTASNIVSPIAEFSAMAQIDYNALHSALLSGAPVEIEINGNTILFSNYTKFNFAPRIFVDEGETYYDYNAPGDWFVVPISKNGDNLIGSHIYISSTHMYARIMDGAIVHSFIPFEGNTNKVDVMYSSENFGIAPDNTCDNTNPNNCSSSPERHLPLSTFDPPERQIAVAFEVDYEYFDGSAGVTSNFKVESAATTMTARLIFSNNTFFHYLNMQFRSNSTAGCDPNFPSSATLDLCDYSNFSQTPIIINRSSDDGLDYNGAINDPNLGGTLVTELFGVYSSNDFRECLNVNLIQHVSGKTMTRPNEDFGVVPSNNSHILSLTPQFSSWFCDEFAPLIRSNSIRGYSIAKQRPLLAPALNTKTSFHELCHNLGLGELEGTNFCPAFDCCNDFLTAYAMCSGGRAFASTDNLFRLGREEQRRLMTLLDVNGDCLEVESQHYVDCLENCSLEVRTGRKFNQPFINCSTPSEIEYTVNVCNNCEPRVISDFGIDYQTSNLSPTLPLSPGYFINPNGATAGGSSDIYQSLNTISFAAGECKQFTFKFELLQYVSGTSINNIVLSTDHNNELTFEVINSGSGSFPQPQVLSGGTLSSPLLLSSLTGSALPESNLSDHAIEFTGVLLVNESYTIDNSSLKLGAQTTIIIEAGSVLTIENSRLLGCGSIWDKILVRSGGALVIQESQVEDAINAIESEDGGMLKIENNTFLNNRTTLYLPGTSNGTISAFGVEFKNNIVDINEDSPHSPIFWTYGIRAQNQKELNIICSPGLENEFNNLTFGIHMTDSRADIRQNRFRHIGRSAIYAKGNQGAVVQPYLFNSGTFGSEPAIKFCRYGVEIQGEVRSFTLYQVIDECFGGIVAHTNRTAFIQSNTLTDMSRFGISAGNMTARPNVLYIRNNTVELEDVTGQSIPGIIGMDAIRILGNDASNSQAYVYDNTIQNENFNGRGINLVNARNVDVRDNTISIESDAISDGIGVEIQGGANCFVSCNDIFNTANLTNQSQNVGNIGLLATSTDGLEASCNRIDQTHIGAEFRMIQMGATVATNEFGTHYHGLKIGHDDPNGMAVPVMVGDQTRTGNTWQQPNFGEQAFLNEVTPLNEDLNAFFVNSAPCASQLFPINNGNNWFNQEPGTNASCYNDGSVPCGQADPTVSCSRGNFGNGLAGPGKVEKFVYGSGASGLPFGVRAAAEDMLFQRGIAGLYAPDSNLIVFSQNFTFTDLGKVAYWNNEMNQRPTGTEMDAPLDSLTDWSLTSTNLFSLEPSSLYNLLSNRATYLDNLTGVGLVGVLTSSQENQARNTLSALGQNSTAYAKRMNTLRAIDGTVWTNAEQAAIHQIARGCPETKGADVFAARSAFWSQYPDSLFVPSCNGGSSESVLENDNDFFNRTAASPGLLVYPNPASSVVNVQGRFTSDLSGSATFEVFDARGKQILSSVVEVHNGKTQLRFAAANWPNGLCYITAEFNGEILHRKIIIK